MKVSLHELGDSLAEDYIRELLSIVPSHWCDLLSQTELIVSSDPKYAIQAIKADGEMGRDYIRKLEGENPDTDLIVDIANIYFSEPCGGVSHKIYILLEKHALESDLALRKRGMIILEEMAESILEIRPDLKRLLNSLHRSSKKYRKTRMMVFKTCFYLLCSGGQQAAPGVSRKVQDIAKKLDEEVRRIAESEDSFSA